MVHKRHTRKHKKVSSKHRHTKSHTKRGGGAFEEQQKELNNLSSKGIVSKELMKRKGSKIKYSNSNNSNTYNPNGTPFGHLKKALKQHSNNVHEKLERQSAEVKSKGYFTAQMLSPHETHYFPKSEEKFSNNVNGL